MLWSAVHVSPLSRTLHGFLTGAPSTKKCFTGMPQKVEDDRYGGKFIPKGTTYAANIWHCNHDRAMFGDDADEFKPERHLDVKREEVLPGHRGTNGEGHVSFSFGRRICVGKHAGKNRNTTRIIVCHMIRKTVRSETSEGAKGEV
jgi:hypothetical protein